MTRLVAYGCSHTAGSELADHIMLDTDIKTCDELKRKYLSQGDTIPQAWEKMWKKFGFSVDPYDLFDQIWKTVKLKEIPFTILLCCQSSSSTIKADVSVAGALTANGNPTATAFWPGLK